MSDVRTIWKYTLSHNPETRVMIQRGFKVLAAQVQHGEICVWALVDPDAPKKHHYFYIVGTGDAAPMPDEVEYIGTVQLQNGRFVFHVFMDTPPAPAQESE